MKIHLFFYNAIQKERKENTKTKHEIIKLLLSQITETNKDKYYTYKCTNMYIFYIHY